VDGIVPAKQVDAGSFLNTIDFELNDRLARHKRLSLQDNDFGGRLGPVRPVSMELALVLAHKTVLGPHLFSQEHSEQNGQNYK
jgi:hypothetical protein